MVTDMHMKRVSYAYEGFFFFPNWLLGPFFAQVGFVIIFSPGVLHQLPVKLPQNQRKCIKTVNPKKEPTTKHLTEGRHGSLMANRGQVGG